VISIEAKWVAIVARKKLLGTRLDTILPFPAANRPKTVMSQIPTNLRYITSHQWARREADVFVVGITDHAQAELGDIVFIDMPVVGSVCAQGKSCSVVESVKTASDVHSPLTGTVVSVNETLSETPELVNTDPYGAGWMFKIKPSDPSEWDQLLDADAYHALL
jgi:glycine cleavage system H protein